MAAEGGEVYRSVEELLDAANEAPTFGCNARELILQAARQIAQETLGPPVDEQQAARDTKQLLRALFKEGPSLLQAMPKEERPLIPFRAIHSYKVPRVSRQIVLERLAGQHLALALHGAGLEISAAALAGRGDLRTQAVEAAVAQEEALYARGKAAKAVYLNFAARTNAGLWFERAGTAEEQPSVQESPAAQAEAKAPTDAVDDPSEPSGPHTEAAGGSTGLDAKTRELKRRKLGQPSAAQLIEADIDWDSACTTAAHQALGAASEDQTAADRAGEPAGDAVSSPQPTASGEQASGRQGVAAQVGSRPAAGNGAGNGRPELPSSAAPDLDRIPSGTVAPVSAAGREDYSPSRHGGESPPQGPSPAALLDQERDGKSAAQKGHPSVVAALLKFLKSHLDPLYDARVVSRPVYKRAMHRTVEKVMRSHAGERSPHFLVREGSRISALLRQYVERESRDEAAKPAV